MANKWLQKITSPFQSSEVKALQNRLDSIVGEIEDGSSYDAKFYDAEPSTGGAGSMFEMAGVDQAINAQALQRLFVTETWVYTAVMAIAKTISGLPMRGEKRTKVSKTILSDITGKLETVEQEVWMEASGEKIFRRFTHPNKFTSKSEFFMLLVIDLLTVGQYFVWLDSDVDLTTVTDATDGDPSSPFARLRQLMASDTPIKGMYRIPPQLMKPMPSETGLGIEVYAMETDRGTFGFNPSEIIHCKLPNPCDMYSGLSPLIPAFKPVLLDRFSTEHIIRFYKSGARLGGVIETEKTLNKEQLGRFQRSFENNYTGRQNHHRTLILPPGMSYKQVEANPAETALLEFCKYNRDAILSVYNVPPIKVGVMDHANYANALVQLKVFFEDTIKPLLGFVEDSFNMSPACFPDQLTFRVRFDLAQVEALKDNFKEKADAAKSMLEGGLTVNEVRKQVWSQGPVTGGEESPVISKMRQGSLSVLEQGNGQADPSAEPTATAESTQAQQDIEENQVTDPALSLNGAQVSAMMQIVQQVAQGFLPRDSGIQMIIVSFSVPRDAAERIMGEVGKTFKVDPAKPTAKPTEPADPTAGSGDTNPTDVPALPIGDEGKSADQADGAGIASDITPTKVTFAQRVNQLVAQFVAAGDPVAVAVPKAIAQAIQEGFNPDDDNDPNDGGGSSGPNSDGGGTPDGSTPPADGGEKLDTATNSAWVGAGDIGTGKPKKPKKEDDEDEDEKAGALSLDQFLRDRLSAMGDTPVDPAVINSLIAEFEVGAGGAAQPKTYRNGMTKDHVVEHWKGFIDKTNPMILRRTYELHKFFKSIKTVVMNKLGANIKTYGLHKGRDEDDVNEITKMENFEKELKEYAAQIDAALADAYKFGYVDTLGQFNFEPPNKVAAKQLKEYAAQRVTGIMDTTRKQLNEVLSKAFEEGVAMGEVSSRIQDKFKEIDAGRAVTIARTETLTAVSMGRQEKRADWQKEFPDRKLMKMWVSSQDDLVRDSHAEYDGQAVGADEEFAPGLKFPRDPECEDASEVINCRCTDITYDAEDQDLINDTLPKADQNDNEE